MIRRRIAFPCVNRSSTTRFVLRNAVRKIQRSGLKVVQISAQQAYDFPKVRIEDHHRLIVPNVTTLGQICALKQKGFVLCDLRTTEPPYRNSAWFDMAIYPLKNGDKYSRPNLEQLSEELYQVLLNNRNWDFKPIEFELNPRFRNMFLA